MISIRLPFALRMPLVAGLLLVVLGGCDPREEPGSPQPAADTASVPAKPRVLLAAFDGLDPGLVERYVAEGRLPNFRRLIERGSLGTIECVVGTSSPVVWTTVATGVTPAEHGITGFTVDDVPVASSLRKVPAFWNVLTEAGLRVATVGWMVSWPAEAQSGIVVSDRAHWGDFEEKVEPPGVIDVAPYDYSRTRGTPEFLARFTDYPYDPEFEARPRDDPAYGVNHLLKKRLVDIHVRDTTYAEIARDVVAENDVDVLAVYFQGADYVGHGFWQWFEPEPFREAGWEVDPDLVEQLGAIVPRYYAYLDRLLGRMLDLVADDALVIALSDHGFQPALGRYATEVDFLSGTHRYRATLVLSGPMVERGVPSGWLTHFDVLPTLLWALDRPLARDLAGHPLLEYFQADYRAAREPLSFVDTYAGQTGEQSFVTRSAHDEEILQELRSLGYIE